MHQNLKVSFVLVLCIVVALTVAAKEKGWGAFDRLLVTQRFLDSAYPELRDSRGLVILRTEEFNAAIKEIGERSEIDIIPCHPGSGVPGGNTAQAPPHCIGLYPSGPSTFLSASVGFSEAFPIRSFSVTGDFVLSRVKPLLKEIADHPEWSQEQRIIALGHADPKFGLEHKQDLVKAVPAEPIRQFTGCALQLSTAILYASRDETPPDPPIASIGWRISGRSRNGRGAQGSCSATFEPFDGKLLNIEVH